MVICRKIIKLGFATVAVFAATGLSVLNGDTARAALLLDNDPGSAEDSRSFPNGPMPEALRQLEQRKQLDRTVAERALQTVPGYRQARRQRIVPSPLGGDLGSCLQALQPGCLLREALAHAYTVSDENRRDWVLGDVAGAFAAHGEPERALHAVALIGDPRRALRSLVAAGLTAKPASPRNEIVLGLLPENTEAHEGIRSAEAGEWEMAFQQASEIAKPRFRAVAWSRIARAADKMGHAQIARNALDAAQADIPKIKVVYGASFAQYEVALTRQAFLDGLKEGAEKVTAQKEAMAAAQAIGLAHLRADMFRRLSAVLTPHLAEEAQRHADAALLETQSKLRQVYVLTGATKSSRSVQRAVEIADTIDDPLDRARAFVRLAGIGRSR